MLTKEHSGHAPCHYCGACGRGCDIGAFFNSYDYLLADALKTGKLEIIENAIVSRILTNDEGVAEKVQYFDRLTGKEVQIPAKRVIVAASAVDSTRILLNSASTRHPNGLGNGSDVIGRYLVEQFRFHVQAYAPQSWAPRRPTTTASRAGISTCRVSRTPTRSAAICAAGACSSGAWDASRRRPTRRHARVRQGLQKDGQGPLSVADRAAPLRRGAALCAQPRHDGRNRKDRFGVPLMQISYKLGENEHKMMQRMYDMVEEALHEMKAEPLPYKRGDIDQLGSAIHEHGTCRMGATRSARRSTRTATCTR